MPTTDTVNPQSSDTVSPSTPLTELPELLTPAEAFRFWRIGRTAGYALLHSGKVRIVRLGRSIRIPRDQLARVA